MLVLYNNTREYTVPKAVTRVQCQSSATQINESEFQNCKQLKEIIFNEGLRTIEIYAFKGCDSLKSITLPSTVTDLYMGSFDRCERLRDVSLNEGLQVIGTYAFSLCYSLQSITIPSTVTLIEAQAFIECTGLVEVVLNEGLQKIGHACFFDCTSLESIVFPSTMVEIAHEAFQNCPNLREVVLNEKIQMIGNDAFDNCPSLTRFTFPASISMRLKNIVMAGQTDIEKKIDKISGSIEISDSGSLFVSAGSEKLEGVRWNAIRQTLHGIIRLITHHEMMESMTLLELALWKERIIQAEVQHSISRDAYHIDIPGPVKDKILSYLSSTN